MGFVSNSGYHLRGHRISDVDGMRKVLSTKLELPETKYAIGQCLGAGSYGSVFDALRWKDVHRGAMKRKNPKRWAALPFHLFRLQRDDISENIKWSISIAKLNNPSGIKSGGLTSTPFSTLGGIYNSREVERPESVPHKQNHRMDSFDVYPASWIINIQRRGVFGTSFPL